jgi:hypothetical protein
VFFREPLKPFFPADDQLMVFPYTSVIVTITLLNVALMNTFPLTSTCIFFLRRVVSVADPGVTFPTGSSLFYTF